MTTPHCHGCQAPLAADQRWCVACGARQPGADYRTLLFGPAQPPAPAVVPRTDAARPAGASAPLPLATRRRRAALPLAVASLAGLVVVTGAGAPASLAGSAQEPFTVKLPAQFAQAPPAAGATVAPPVEVPVEPAIATPPVAETPVAQTPVAEPAAMELPATGTPAAEAPAAETPAAETVAAERPAERERAAAERDAEQRQQAHDAAPAPVRRVFLIALGGADVNALAADPTAAPYLAGTLARSGTLLSDYRTVARGGLAERIALISGQGPTAQTLDDCTTYGDVSPADALALGQTGGDGCVYGAESSHLGDQLRELRSTWKAYVEPATAEAGGACDAGAGTTRRNPFLWFRTTVEARDCDERNVSLAQLEADLSAAETTPALSWIASDAQQGSADADRFLERVVPQIQRSPAYADGGLIVIVGDLPPDAPEAQHGRALAPTTYANVGDAAAAGAGVPVGALLISARTPSGKVDATPANAFTLLRTLQRIYGVDPLGYSAARGVAPLPDQLFSRRP